MRILGRLVRLQIQRDRLKPGEGNARVYTPAPLLAVPALHLTRSGALGPAPDGGWLLDVHHADHPSSRSRGDNALSFSFTSHYAAMRGRFGAHLGDGIAGENLLVDALEIIDLKSVCRGVAVRSAATGALLTLVDVVPAPPCAPFARFALGGGGDAVEETKAALQFLLGGMRGFYGRVEAPGSVALGDEVVAL
jgi:hypothetical protein